MFKGKLTKNGRKMFIKKNKDERKKKKNSRKNGRVLIVFK